MIDVKKELRELIEIQNQRLEKARSVGDADGASRIERELAKLKADLRKLNGS